MKKALVQTGLILLFGTLFLISCSPRSSPPGPSSATGVIEDAGYAFHVWQDGLRILILHNTPNAFFCQGEGGSSSPVYHLECDTDSLDGRKLSWEIETVDGTNA